MNQLIVVWPCRLSSNFFTRIRTRMLSCLLKRFPKKVVTQYLLLFLANNYFGDYSRGHYHRLFWDSAVGRRHPLSSACLHLRKVDPSFDPKLGIIDRNELRCSDKKTSPAKGRASNCGLVYCCLYLFKKAHFISLSVNLNT